MFEKRERIHKTAIMVSSTSMINPFDGRRTVAVAAIALVVLVAAVQVKESKGKSKKYVSNKFSFLYLYFLYYAGLSTHQRLLQGQC